MKPGDRDEMENWYSKFNMSWKDKTLRIVVVTAIVIAIAIAAIAGVGLLATIGLGALIVITAFFGSFREFTGSLLLAALLKIVGANIREMLEIWYNGPAVAKFFALVANTSYMHLALALFFFSFLLSFATGSVKLLRFENSNKVEAPKKEDKPPKASA